MLVILEGVSAVGKSAIMLEYFRTYNDVVMICRFTPSNYVYGQMKNRIGEIPLPELLEIDQKIKNSAIIFHLMLDQNILEKRQERDDVILDRLRLEELYNEYYKLTPIPHEKININGMTPKQIVEEIRRRLKKRGFLMQKIN